MNAVITFLIRLLEVMFVAGGIGCICSVIPMTAHRLFMVLFEEDSPGTEAASAQRQTGPEASTLTSATPESGN